MEGRFQDTFLDSLCYVSEHVGFYGAIKHSPADFVVTEIHVTGHLVTVDHTQEPEDKLTDNDNEPQYKKQKADLEDVEGKTIPGQAECKGEYEPVRENVDDASEALAASDCEAGLYNLLNLVLSIDVQKALLNFANSVKSAFESQVERCELCELSLGFFSNKDDRAIVHSAVRQTFPVLVTFTKNSELLVKPNLDYQELSRLTSEEEAGKFFTFLDAKVQNSTFTFQPDVSKEHRTSVHHFISRKFGKLVETKSFSEKGIDGVQRVSITVRFREKKSSSGKRQRTEEQSEIFTAFTLEKENLETLEAISYLSSVLGVLPSDFSYAGIKDKKAITYQSMVVKKVTPERMQKIESSLGKRGIKIQNVRPAKCHIHLGQLSGNHFTLIVRNIRNHSGDPSENLHHRIEEAVHSVKERGFLNYYGPQRFGKGQNMQSQEVGLTLLKEEMALAVKLFFTPEDCDDPVNKAKRYFFESGDAKGALALMPEFKVRERMMLRALNRYGMSDEGYVRSWLSIPHSMRIFYIHAYCSKIWNEAASYRIATYGLRVVEGDLVLCCKDENTKSSLCDRVHTVTATEEAENVYLMNQVVLPMPGHSIKYPSNQVGHWYKEALAKAGLQLCKFRVGPLQLNIPGCYRHILKYPRNLSYELFEEDDVQNQDKEKWTKPEIVQPANPLLKLSFELDSSCYATVCLREMMKCNF
ncbi:PREDICTED: pseudouridylate synthase 7 homolog-like protein [Nanorana parkeri]|uniref:pseudouridylate synthase 7 homolog-like protein n=1 Tax=Nanorana parkeri TaxID=125878 RepID=UPI000854B911|nr:PREDICTED: pseudouridylate synthase 7 homolog-like protein [Nanorana parkeri]